MAIEKHEKIVAVTLLEGGDVLQVTRETQIVEDGNILMANTNNTQYWGNANPGEISSSEGHDKLHLRRIFTAGSEISFTVNNASYTHTVPEDQDASAVGAAIEADFAGIVVEHESVDVNGMYADTVLAFKQDEDATDYFSIADLNIHLQPVTIPDDVKNYLEEAYKIFDAGVNS